MEFLSRNQGAILKLMLGFIVMLFISILITLYVVAKSANPIILDEQGRPMNAGSSQHHAESRR